MRQVRVRVGVPIFDRAVSGKLRRLALEQNVEFRCLMCGAENGDADPYDPGRCVTLKVSYIIPKQSGGYDDTANLQAICSTCQAGLRHLRVERPSAQKLLIQVRRAPGVEQVKVLRWLVGRFPRQAVQLLADKP
jgi:hypothetical protein